MKMKSMALSGTMLKICTGKRQNQFAGSFGHPSNIQYMSDETRCEFEVTNIAWAIFGHEFLSFLKWAYLFELAKEKRLSSTYISVIQCSYVRCIRDRFGVWPLAAITQ